MSLFRPLIILMIFFLLACCQTGRIPCPKPKKAKSSAKVPKRYRSYVREVSQTREASVPEQEPVARKARDPKFVNNVSIEEWDCPEPGKKKYLPKRVRNNIKRNYHKVMAGYHEQPADSLSN